VARPSREAPTPGARRTAHGARRTAHGARRTAHGARRTARIMERVRAIPEGFVRSYGGIDPIFGILGRITRRTRLVAVSA
jgi:hypothetical protein